MLARKVLIGAAQIAGGMGTNQLLSFARNVVIARIVGPEQLGLALTFVLMVSFVEMASDLSWGKFVVQDRDGDSPRLQSTLHVLLLVRGFLIAVALFIGAGLVVDFFAVPASLAWAYRMLAVVPLMVGLNHLDVKRFQRTLRYGPDVMSQAAGNVAALAVGVALALWLRDYRAMLFAILAKYIATAVLSHVLAERPYQLSWSRDVLDRAWAFGWPLMVNGAVLFAATQGDRAVVVRAFGLETLGMYGAASFVTQAVGVLSLSIVSSIGLPILAERQRSTDFVSAYDRLGSVVSLSTVAIAVPAFFALPQIVPHLFGAQYQIPTMLISVQIAALSIQMFRNWAVVGALALGASPLIMIANICRTSGILIAILLVARGGAIVDIAAAQVGGELIATALIFAQLRVRVGLPVERAALLFTIVGATTAAALVVAWSGAASNPVLWTVAHAAIFAAGAGALWLASADVRALAEITRALA